MKGKRPNSIGLHHRLIVILPWWLLAPGTLVVLAWSIRNFPLRASGWLPVAVGILAGVAMGRWIRIRRHKQSLSTLEHELTHSIVALLFLRKVSEINAGLHGGHMSHSGGFGGKVGDIYISLAPYYLPTFSVILALIRPFVLRQTLPGIDVLIGLSLAYHTLSTIRETHSNWPGIASDKSDISRTGTWTSVLTIVPLTLFLHTFVMYNLVSNRGLLLFLRAILRETLHFWL